jgi:hypothetical protein
VDGFWVDGEIWASHLSWSEPVKEEFTRRTGIADVPVTPEDEHWDAWVDYQRDLFVEHVTEYANAIHAKHPDVAVCSNWMYSVRQPSEVEAPVDYLSGDFDPSFGAERANAEARFLASRRMPWNLMAWTFLRTGAEMWTMKSVPHLCQEAAVVLAQGGSVFLYNQPQRSGRITEWHQDILADVARFCKARKEYCFQSETVPQAAILHSESWYLANCSPLFGFDAFYPMEGALHAVLENGYSADLLNETALMERMDQYPLVIVPRYDNLPGELKQALTDYVRKGGRMVMSGSHLARQFPELTGTQDAGVERDLAYLPANGGAVTSAGPWREVALDGAEPLAMLLDQQEPELNKTAFPAATVNAFGQGLVVAAHGPIFENYYHGHYTRIRAFIGELLDKAAGGRLIRLEGPPSVELAARRKGGRMLLQCINRSSANRKAPNRHMVEHVPQSGPFTVTAPMKQKPRNCRMAPSPVGMEWSWDDGVFTARVDGIHIHEVLVIE